MAIFDTSDVGQDSAASPVTVKAPIAPMSPDTFKKEVAIGLFKEGATQMALSEQAEGQAALQDARNDTIANETTAWAGEGFEAFKEAQEQGMSASEASARSRAILSQAKTTAPWAAARLDAQYKGIFGGSGGTGSDGPFKLSPEEQAAADYSKNVADQAAARGISLRQADEELRLVAETEMINNLHANGGVKTQAFVQSSLNNRSAMMQVAIKSELQNGTLKPESIMALNATVSNTANQLRMQIRSAAFGEGKNSLGTEEMNTMNKQIDEWETRQKSLLKDRSYQELMVTLEDTSNKELSLAANEMLPVFKVLQNAGGSELVKSFISGMQNKEYIASLVDQFPQLASFFETSSTNPQVAQVKGQQKLAGVLAKFSGQNIQVKDPNDVQAWAVSQMGEGGAELGYEFMKDRNNVKSTSEIIKQTVSDDPETASTAKDAHTESANTSPEAAAKFYHSEAWKLVKENNPDGASATFFSGMKGMKQNMNSAIVAESGSFPDNITIEPIIRDGVETSFRVMGDGEPLPDKARATVGHIFSALKDNPEYVQEWEEVLGIPLTKSEVLEIALSNKMPQKFLDRRDQQILDGSFLPFHERERRSALAHGGFLSKLIQTWNDRPTREELIKRNTRIDPTKAGLNQTEKVEEPTVDEGMRQRAVEAHKKAIEEAEKAGVPKETIKKLQKDDIDDLGALREGTMRDKTIPLAIRQEIWQIAKGLA